jgi:PST family polysaccharide transporter
MTAELSPAGAATSDPPAIEDPSGQVGRGTRFRPALLWSYILSTGTYAITALMTFILAAILGPHEFGVLWMAVVWVTLAQILLQHGPTLAVIQHEHITDRHLNAAFWSTLAGALLFTAVLAATAPLWAAVNRLPELTPVCLALAPIVPLYALNVIPEALLRRRMQLRGIAVRYLTAGLVSGVAGVACALAGLGVWALVVQQVGMTLLATVMLWAVTPWRPRLGPFRRELREIRGTSVKTLAGAVGDFASMRIDVLLMGALFGPVVVGLFRFAVRFPEMVVDLTARGLQTISLPDLARHSEDPAALAARLRRLVHAGVVFSVPALGVLAAAAEPLVLIIGDQWADSVQPLRLLCLVSVFLLLHSLLGAGLQAAQRPGLPAVMTWVTAIATGLAILSAGLASAGAGTADQLLAVASAMLLVQLPLTGVLAYLTFRRVLHVSAWPTLRAAVPSLLAAGAALATGAALPELAGRGPVLGFLLTAGLAGAAAGAVLLILDREARSWLTLLLGRVRDRS